MKKIAMICVATGLMSAANMAFALESEGKAELVDLFKEWRTFEHPPTYQGVSDYRQKTFDQRKAAFQALQKKLKAMPVESWAVEDQVDWHVIRAEMNGYDFNYRVLKPWQRDPAFYKSVWTDQSDVPAHEGPTPHDVTELWTYEFPLNAAEEKRLTADLSKIAPFNAQAKDNLTGNARDLWVTGIRDIDGQVEALRDLKKSHGSRFGAPLLAALDAAIASTRDLADWLRAEAPKKNGPSGLGKENYTWYQQNVHLVPLTWEDEERLLKRELDRAWSSLKLEEQRNRDLPPLKAASTPAEFERLADQSVDKMLNFLEEKKIVTVADYFRPALEDKKGSFVPEAKRNFFYIGMHFNPLPLYSHFYHWFELARVKYDPHANPIRRGPVLYNIFDSRNEGTATAVEEMFMHAGLYDDNPRAREIVWIMLAQRAARGLGSLYAHANEMTMEEAGQIHMDYTPRGWMKMEPELKIFEQHLYLRQPGYGTSYITGKYLLERALADYGKMREENGKAFNLKDFFDELNSIGGIPVSLGRWQMTGEKEAILSR